MTLAPLTSLGLVVANHSTRDEPTSLCNQAKCDLRAAREDHMKSKDPCNSELPLPRQGVLTSCGGARVEFPDTSLLAFRSAEVLRLRNFFRQRKKLLRSG